MNILALDPATNTGFAWSDGRTVYSGVWNLGSDPHPGSRMLRLAEEIRAVHAMRGFEALAFEEASVGAGARVGRGIQWNVVVFHNKIRGVIEMVASELGVKCLPVFPSTIKSYVAGSGKAKKEQVMRAVETHLGIATTDDNEGDALAILIWARDHPEGHVGKKQIAKKARAMRKKIPKLF